MPQRALEMFTLTLTPTLRFTTLYLAVELHVCCTIDVLATYESYSSPQMVLRMPLQLESVIG